MLIAFLLFSEIVTYPPVSGTFWPFDGFCRLGTLYVKNDGIWIGGNGAAVLLEQNGEKRFTVSGYILDMVETEDRVIIATNKELSVFELDGRLAIKKDVGYRKLVLVKDKLFGIPIDSFKKGYPFLVHPIDLEDMSRMQGFIRAPGNARDRGIVWITSLGNEDFLWFWSHAPDRFFITTRLTRKTESENGFHLPGASYYRVFEEIEENPKQPITRDRYWQRMQESLRGSQPICFQKVNHHYALAREVGIAAPDVVGKEIFISPAVEILIFDHRLELVDKTILEGTFGGFHDGGVYMVFDGEKPASAKTRYKEMNGSPIDRARGLLGNQVTLRERTLQPVVEKVLIESLAND